MPHFALSYKNNYLDDYHIEYENPNDYNYNEDIFKPIEDDTWQQNENKARIITLQNDNNNINNIETDYFPIERKNIKKCKEIKYGPFPIISDELVIPQQYHNISCKDAGHQHHHHHTTSSSSMNHCMYCTSRICEPTIKEISVFKKINPKCWSRSILKVEAGCKCY